MALDIYNKDLSEGPSAHWDVTWAAVTANR